MREYETVFVLDPALDDSRVEQEIETVSNLITQGGGEVLEVQRWGRRRLAYEVQKKREGIYSLIRYKSEREVLTELKRRFHLNESLLRHMTVLSLGPSAPPSSEGFHHERRGDGFGHGDRRGDRHGEGFGRERRGDRHSRERRVQSVASEQEAAPSAEPAPAGEPPAAGNGEGGDAQA